MKRWTDKEDSVLAKNVKENYENLVIAFKKTSLEIDRTIPACKQRWYGWFCVNPKAQKQYNVCFVTMSNKKEMLNRKTLPINYSKDIKLCNKKSKLRTLMNRILALFDFKQFCKSITVYELFVFPSL